MGVREIAKQKRDTVVYELYNKGRKVYIGITDDPDGRRHERKQNRTFDHMRTVTGKRTAESARKEEQGRIETYQKRTGKRPEYNKT